MRRAAIFLSSASLLLLSATSPAFAWGSVHGPNGGAAYRGPMGRTAAVGPNGGAAYRGPAVGAVRGPEGNTAVRTGGYYHGGTVYRGGYYGAPAAGVAAGVAVGAAVGTAAAASSYYYPPPYYCAPGYNCPPPY